jgi:hypothetical protein
MEDNNISWKDVASILFLIGIIIACLSTLDRVNKSDVWNVSMITISVGLLAFVAVFYSFVLKKEINDRRESVLVEEWQKHIPKIQELLASIQAELTQPQPQYANLSTTSTTLSQEFDDMSSFEKGMDINGHLSKAVFSFLLVIAIVFYDGISGVYLSVDNSFFHIRLIGYIIFWVGLYFSFSLVICWQKLVKPGQRGGR